MITQNSLVFGCIGIILIILAFLLQVLNGKKTIKLLLLICGSLFIFTAAALLDPFIHIWDEQYHGLVAKNLGQHFFHPTLYENTPLGYDYTLWIANHTWVHKQPLFLWQMAISMKIFGENEFAIRLPSVIMSVIMVLFIFQIGTYLKNERTGMIAAVFFALNYFSYNLVSGFYHTDHNDLTFAFYILASVWSYIKYRQKGQLRWALLCGLFSGCAVLTKWLTGILIFSAWGIGIIFHRERIKSKREFRNLFFALLTCVIVFLPWQLFIMQAYPLESSHEYKMAGKHFFEVIEGHDGTNFYHFEQMQKIFFNLPFLHYLFFFAILLFIFRDKRPNLERISFLAMIVIVYLFFTLAKTKMPAFTYMVAPLCLIVFASLIDDLWNLLSKIKYKYAIVISNFIGIFLVGFFADYGLKRNQLYEEHADHATNHYRWWRSKNVKIYRDLNADEKTIIFNVPEFEPVMLMFYSNATAYQHIPDLETCEMLIKKGYEIQIFKKDNIPEHLLNHPYIKIISPSPWE